VIFRRTYVDLQNTEERLLEIVGSTARYNASRRVLLLGPRIIRFGALERPTSEFGGRDGRMISSGSTKGRSSPRTRCVGDGLEAQLDAGPALPRGDRLEPADRAARPMAGDVVCALARPQLSESGQAGGIALALHARGRIDRVGRRPRPHLIDGNAAPGDVLHVHSGAALRQPLPARHRLPRNS
jgi:hypothetical protein